MYSGIIDLKVRPDNFTLSFQCVFVQMECDRSFPGTSPLPLAKYLIYGKLDTNKFTYPLLYPLYTQV